MDKKEAAVKDNNALVRTFTTLRFVHAAQLDRKGGRSLNNKIINHPEK